MRHFRRGRGEDKMAALGEPVRLERGEYEFCRGLRVSLFSADFSCSLISAASAAAPVPGPDSSPWARAGGGQRELFLLVGWAAPCSRCLVNFASVFFFFFFFSPRALARSASLWVLFYFILLYFSIAQLETFFSGSCRFPWTRSPLVPAPCSCQDC